MKVQCEKEVIISIIEWKYTEAIKPQPVVFSLWSDSMLINELWRNKQADLLCPCLLISFSVSPPEATLPTPRWSSKRLSWHGQVVLLLCFGKISSAQRSDPHHHDVCLHSHTGPPGTDSGHLKLNHGKRQSYIAQKEKVRQEKTLSPICNEVCGTVDCTGPFWQSDADLAAAT